MRLRLSSRKGKDHRRRHALVKHFGLAKFGVSGVFAFANPPVGRLRRRRCKGLLSAFGETAILMEGAAAIRTDKMAAGAAYNYQAETVGKSGYL